VATDRIAGEVHLNIEVRIQCTPQDLDGLGEKLKKVLEDFGRHEGKSEPDVLPPESDTKPE
jgi:hypothetical protein